MNDILIPSDERVPLSLCAASALVDKESFHGTATLLIRPRSIAEPGLYAYHESSPTPNIRATRLAMFCGHWAFRFYGTVILSTDGTLTDNVTSAHSSGSLSDYFEEIVVLATHPYSPDLRVNLQIQKEEELSPVTPALPISPSSDWIGNAAREHYQDTEAIQFLQRVMQPDYSEESNEEQHAELDGDIVNRRHPLMTTTTTSNIVTLNECVTHVPVCYLCRKPASTLCVLCQGVYFCSIDCEHKGCVLIQTLFRLLLLFFRSSSHSFLLLRIGGLIGAFVRSGKCMRNVGKSCRRYFPNDPVKKRRNYGVNR
jgi:hypothetical protein